MCINIKNTLMNENKTNFSFSFFISYMHQSKYDNLKSQAMKPY